MTKIEISEEKINVYGHSGYGTYGNDIVCAAISALVEATYNYLKLTNNKIKNEEDDGKFIIYLLEINETGKQIINGFRDMIEDLVKQYPKYIEMR